MKITLGHTYRWHATTDYSIIELQSSQTVKDGSAQHVVYCRPNHEFHHWYV